MPSSQKPKTRFIRVLLVHVLALCTPLSPRDFEHDLLLRYYLYYDVSMTSTTVDFFSGKAQERETRSASG